MMGRGLAELKRGFAALMPPGQEAGHNVSSTADTRTPGLFCLLYNWKARKNGKDGDGLEAVRARSYPAQAESCGRCALHTGL